MSVLRLTLNYKKLPYRTVRIEYPEIEGVSKEQGAPPSSTWPDGRPKYTLPMIYDPNTRVAVSDSAEIAKYLDKTYPDTPQLFPTGTVALQHIALDFLVMNIQARLGMAIPPERVGLTPQSLAHLKKSLVMLFGKSHDELDTAFHWKGLEKCLGRYAAYLAVNGAEGNGGNSLLMGDKICFADFQLAGTLLGARAVCGENSEEWAQICAWHDGKWKRFVEGLEKYTSADQ